jgi:uncharacterized DUF497 family protein/predicted DNA binding CopG/RHH family protein
MAVKFEWDQGKNRANIKKHGIGFADVVPVFDDPLSLTIPERLTDGELRYRTALCSSRTRCAKCLATRMWCASPRLDMRRHLKEGHMKKANTKERNAAPIAAGTSDAEIDTSDIPEITDWTGAVRGLFARPQTRQISIRLGAADLVMANRLAAKKGLPYQTYIKSLLHEAIENERKRLAH